MGKDGPGRGNSWSKSREPHKWGEGDRKTKKGVSLVCGETREGGKMEEPSRAGF